ncbi:hypothetical protein IIE18_27300 [Pseudomonas sp. V1]|nr:hypothetical protein [Pseudomonas arcuscaelestis]
MTAASLGAVSLASGAAGTLLEATGKDAKAAGILGWVSLGSGLAGGALEVSSRAAFSGLVKQARSIGRAMSRQTKSGRFPRAVKRARYEQWEGRTEILASGVQGHDVAIHENLWDLDVLAFETHGNARGQLFNQSRHLVSATRFAQDIVKPRLAKLNYPANEPIILLACMGGKSGAAKKIADTAGHPVVAFVDSIDVASPAYMNQPLSLKPNYKTFNWPTRDRMDGEPRFFSNNAKSVPAQFSVFWPSRRA